MSKSQNRDRYLQSKYGITLTQYEKILRSQGGCAICGKSQKDEKRSLAVDHNHKTGEVRGILCMFCNHRLVGRHTDPALLRKMADYISQGTGFFVPKKIKKKRKRRKK